MQPLLRRTAATWIRGFRGGAPAARTTALVALVASAMWSAPAQTAPPNETPRSVAAAGASRRWTAETPDAMIAAAKERAIAKGADGEALAAIFVIAGLEARAERGAARRALDAIAEQATLDADVRAEAGLLSLALSEEPAEKRAALSAERFGVVSDLAVLGPFRDNGGGLERAEGPEAQGGSFADLRRRYAWGSFDVAWRAVPRAFVGAEGAPLSLFVHPRKESCSYVASRVTVPTAQPIVVRLAASGQVRLAMNDVELGRSDEVHAHANADRLAARVEATAGSHLLYAKVCSGALDDEGRVRIRITDPEGRKTNVSTSAELADPRGTPAKLAVRKLPTPLTRALAAKGSADALLAGVIARTLGGADDLRSPRAPGQLDAVTLAVKNDADRLAMAGWVAPFGANRSGWLNAARALAKGRGDASTLAFVERRLVAEHTSNRMADWAFATLRSAGLESATDAEAVVLRAQVHEALGVEALRVRALRELEALVGASNDRAPSAALATLSRVATWLAPGRAREAREALAARGERNSAWVHARVARGGAAVAEAARATFDGELANADEALAVAAAVSSTGAFELAQELYGRIIAFAPNRHEAWAGLAESASAAHKGSAAERQATIATALRRARELAPGDARYRAELALRQGKQSPSEHGGRDDERYLVSPQTILARRTAAPIARTAADAPDVAERQLHWLRAVVMHEDRRVSQLMHYAREIVIEPRTQEELFEEIPIEGELTEILRARVHRKDGGTAFPTEEHNEGSRPRIRWPDLKSGDVVEVAVRAWTGGPVGGRGDPPFYFLDYVGSTSTRPLLYNEVIVESSSSHPIHVALVNGEADEDETHEDGHRSVRRLIWRKPKMVADEPLAPALSETVPMVVGSTFASWSDFRAWYAEAVRGFTEPDEQVRRLALELTKGKRTREQKIAALFEFVADDIRYVNYVSGEWWLPNRPQQLLARREGDCDDKAILLISLLKVIGIDAEEVLVQTRMTGQPNVLRAKGAAVPMFDHGIAYIPPQPGGGPGMWLDATSPQSRLGPLPSMDARAFALRLNGPAEITQLPPSSPAEHGVDVSWSIALRPDGSGDLVAEERHSGDAAFWSRTYLTEEGARAQYVEEGVLARWFSSVELDPKVDFKGNLPGGQAWLAYRAKSDGLARREEDELVLPLAQSVTYASQLAPLVQRTLPVVLPPHLAPSHEIRRVRVVAPAGYRFADLPPAGVADGGEFGRATLEIARDPKDPRAVVVRREVLWDMSTIPVDKYVAWRRWIQRIDALMHKQLRLVPAGDTKPKPAKPAASAMRGAP
jgi:hypothetical protein